MTFETSVYLIVRERWRVNASEVRMAQTASAASMIAAMKVEEAKQAIEAPRRTSVMSAEPRMVKE